MNWLAHTGLKKRIRRKMDHASDCIDRLRELKYKRHHRRILYWVDQVIKYESNLDALKDITWNGCKRRGIPPIAEVGHVYAKAHTKP